MGHIAEARHSKTFTLYARQRQPQRTRRHVCSRRHGVRCRLLLVLVGICGIVLARAWSLCCIVCKTSCVPHTTPQKKIAYVDKTSNVRQTTYRLPPNQTAAQTTGWLHSREHTGWETKSGDDMARAHTWQGRHTHTHTHTTYQWHCVQKYCSEASPQHSTSSCMCWQPVSHPSCDQPHAVAWCTRVGCGPCRP